MSNPFLKQVFNKDKTFRPKRKFEPGTQRFELHKKAQASLNAGLDLKLAVQLPPGEELSDWVAVHVVDFFNRVNLIYGTIGDECTEQSCPVMSGGPKYEYRWQDEHQFRKPTALSAPRYMDLLMDWIEVQINNEELFPTHVGTPFPKNFLPVVRKILSRLFRVFVHVYIHHFDRIAQMGSEAHVNTCYKHFYYFVKEFGLIDTKELEPLLRASIPSSFLPYRCFQFFLGPARLPQAVCKGRGLVLICPLLLHTEAPGVLPSCRTWQDVFVPQRLRVATAALPRQHCLFGPSQNGLGPPPPPGYLFRCS
ncbi:MOB kinase activator 3A isoform X1 [Acinonyx jubatus]|uniref:MOB kinase activator 3A isoform X1 n=1 Tax=Acinonyx jubatus TaxID=32536 RepID=A0A6J0A1X8_ACIJB|nr:MOB kinase activator 3A isoform X1 [Acinonyx jubatus]XP_026905137.1 MOB kinase activator 3A isoform X1 [Acinonyx jubatus]XP_026905138.1 MOB kinase activator 3A isoform X1 [Acinonyx jubatus]XP_053076161.1 MOB kinase activator 3A isoform X1 [Acinonyx jubatus]